MYVLVRLLKGFPRPLFYKVSSELNNNNNLVGKIVQVPLKNKNIPALVLKTYKNLPSNIDFQIKDVVGLQEFPNDFFYHEFIEKISKFYFTQPLHFYRRIRNFLFKDERKIKKDMEIKQIYGGLKSKVKVILTYQQQKILAEIEKFIDAKIYASTLLHGVTGSGKTEIYKRLIIKTIKNNKSVILLLPEVGLSLQFQFLLQNQLPSYILIIGFHSASKQKEKKELWQRLLEGKPTLIIGVHLPVLLPISNLGLIIVDEEHEVGFQEKKHPKINSKQIAIWRAQHYKIPVILGSATPCLNSLYNVKNKNWHFFQLKERFSGSFPKIQLVFLNDREKKRRKSFWISKELENAIREKLYKKEQVIIYLNRRGYSFFVQCKKCGFIFQCPNCSVSLTLHKTDQNLQILRCHYCDYHRVMADFCPECKASSKELLKKGIGTQQAVSILQNIFPQAKIERADLDSTSKKRTWQKTVERFEKGEIDILVGTQTITKGYHFPKVTLVGILWADLNLHFPVFNAAETALQKIIQVAGRAGRQSDSSKVIVQAMQDHYIFNHLNEKDYLKFCEKEMEFRQATSYPPFGRLVQIELKNTDAQVLEKEAEILCDKLHKINKTQNLGIKILGPSRPIVYRVQKTEFQHIFLKTNSFLKVYKLLEVLDFNSLESSVFIVPT